MMTDRTRQFLNRLPQLALVLAALILMVRTERFFTPGTLTSILTQASIVGVLALGQAFVLIGGGFDLSQGAMLALTAAATAHLAQRDVPPILVGATALTMGGLLGSVNGVMVAVVRTNPFVTTLSTLLIFRGAAFILLGGQPLANIRVFQAIDSGFNLGSTFVPLRGLLFLALAVLAWLVLRQTVFGQHIYALGGNAQAAAPCGSQDGQAPGRDFHLERPGSGRGHDPFPLVAAGRQARYRDGLRARLDRRMRRWRGLSPGRPGKRPGRRRGLFAAPGIADPDHHERLPGRIPALVTGIVILIFAAADALARRHERA